MRWIRWLERLPRKWFYITYIVLWAPGVVLVFTGVINHAQFNIHWGAVNLLFIWLAFASGRIFNGHKGKRNG